MVLYNSDLSGGSAVSTAAAAGFGSDGQQSDRRRPPDHTHGRSWCGQIFAPAAHRRAAACLTRRFVSSQPTRRRAAASKINVSSQTPRRIGRNCTVFIVRNDDKFVWILLETAKSVHILGHRRKGEIPTIIAFQWIHCPSQNATADARVMSLKRG